MKRIITMFAAILMTASIFAQAPQKMSYQAVIRNSNNQLVTSGSVGMQISVLKGDVTGTAVYVERQFPTTNANGLVSLEIGAGTVVSGDFSTIDWGSDTYFIKTETDLNGGSNYTISGTSQLLSVPYALHAQTAESITGGITETDPVFATSIANGITATDTTNWNSHTVDTDTHIDSAGIADLGFVAGDITETDPVFTASQAANITSSDITKLNNLSGTNTGDQTISRAGSTVTLSNGGSFQDSVNVYTAGDGIEITNNVISKHKYQIGDYAQGGIIFWLDETGEHGLVCAKKDVPESRWYAGTYGVTHAGGFGFYGGKANTIIIIAAQVAIGDDGNTYAARSCNEYQFANYDDWYLPSRFELYEMHKKKSIIDATATQHGGDAFAPKYYWSSTEKNASNAYGTDFSNGSSTTQLKDKSFRIRPIRSF